MKQYINKDAVVAGLNRLIAELVEEGEDTMFEQGRISAFEDVKVFINHTLEVKDPYEQCVKYDSVKAGIQAHAETYSFNIESELFSQLTTKEQQKLWRKEIEQACVSGGEAGVELAREPRYKENLEVKEVEEEPVSNDLEEAIKKYLKSLRKSHFEGYDIERAFKKGAQWQKERILNNATEREVNWNG